MQHSNKRKKELREFVINKLFEQKLIITFIAVIIIVEILSFIYNWPELASRLGALMVASGVFIEFFIARAVSAENDEKMAHWVKFEIKTKSIINAESVLKMNFPERNIIQQGQNGTNMIDWWSAAAVFLESPFVKIEFAFILTGTVLWAFGDWLVEIVHCKSFSDGVLSCIT